MSITVLCPRCGVEEFTPYGVTADREQLDLAPRPAVSRITREPGVEPVYVCSKCGVAEALYDYFQFAQTTPDQWPMEKPWDGPEEQT